MNAFSISWPDFKSYIFSIIGKILAKLFQGKATATLVVPCWQTQAWFQQFVKMIKMNPGIPASSVTTTQGA